MHLRTYLATTRRILTQLRADRRTVGLIAIVPAALLTLLYFVYRDYPGADLLFNHIAVSMMAILPTTVMFLVTSVAMLRERVSGTLERLWTTPIHRADLLFGYATAFAMTAVIQSLILCAVAAWGLDVDISASWGWVLLTALVNAFVGVSLGLLVSAFAPDVQWCRTGLGLPYVDYPRLRLSTFCRHHRRPGQGGDPYH